MPDDLFAALYGDTASLPAPGVHDVRTRARRHTRNRRLAAGGATFAVLIMVAGGVAFAGRGTGPEPPPPLSSADASPSPTGTPSPAPSAGSPSAGTPSSPNSSPSRPPLTKLTAGAMLQPQDLGGTYSQAEDNPDGESGDWSLAFYLSWCDESRNHTFPNSADKWHRRIQPDEPAQPPFGLTMIQRAELFTSDTQARAAWDWYQKVTGKCRSFPDRSDASKVIKVDPQVISAGDRALLVTLTTADGSRYMYAYVQVGRIWTEFMVPNQLARPNQPASQADGTRLAQKAAERMRNAQR